MSDFKYSLNGSTIRTTGVMRQIEVAAAAGYVGIELWFDKIDEHTAAGGTVTEIKQALDDHGLAVPTTIYLYDWFDTTGASYEQALEESKRRMEIGAQLGAPFVIAGPPRGMADYELGAQHYRQLLEIGTTIGIKPAMEFLGFVEQLNTIEDALDVMERSGRGDATTVLDPAHIYRGGGSVEAIAKLRPQQIAISHFDDCPADVPQEIQHDEHRVMPGEGIFDLQRYLNLLREIGYCEYLSLELFREDLWAGDPLEVVRIGLEKMRAVVEQ